MAVDLIQAVNTADGAALDRLLGVRPVLCDIARAADVIDLDGRVLLHAGPPVAAPGDLALPVRHSALLAILYEGWAASREAAERLLDAGEIALRSAQDHGVAVPLADVLSPTMAVLVVEDANAPGRRAFSTLNGGDGPVMRVGTFSDAVLERLRWINHVLAPVVQPWFAGASIDLIDVADHALCGTDDCHGRTQHASLLLAEELLKLPGAASASTDVRSFLQGAPAFFLNAWMAAVKCILQVAEGVPGSSVVTAIGGNGHAFGIKVAAWPQRWFVTAATAPLIPGASDEMRAASLGAIGDSAIVDAFGGGAMAARHAPTTAARLDAVCAEYALKFPAGLLETPHPAFERLGGLRVGLTVRRAHALAQTPAVSLGVLDVAGQRGRLDGGFYFCAPEPFEAAWHALKILENEHETA